MTKLPRVSGREVGVFKRQHGSHTVLRREEPFAQVVMPDHRELDKRTLRAILRQAGITIEEFSGLL